MEPITTNAQHVRDLVSEGFVVDEDALEYLDRVSSKQQDAAVKLALRRRNVIFYDDIIEGREIITASIDYQE